MRARLALAIGARLERVRLRGLPRLFYVTAPFLLGRGLRPQRTISGISVCADVRDYASCMMVYGRFQPELMALLPSLCRPGDSVIDVGAQLGYVTSRLAERVGANGSVLAIEPDPNALRQLRATVNANRHAQVTVLPLAAANSDGELTLYVSPTLGWSTPLAGTHHRDLSPLAVACARLDTLAAQRLIRRPVRLIKIDVEGFEAAVLDGAQRLIGEDRPFVVLEIHRELLSASTFTAADVLARLPAGYRFQRIAEPRGLFAGGRVMLEPVEETRLPVCCDVLCSP